MNVLICNTYNKKCHMEIAFHGINARVVDVSETSLVRWAHSFDFWYKNNWYVNNSCVNTVRPHFL